MLTGSLAVGVGLMVYGLTSYAFLIIAARALGPERYAPLSVLWALLYLLAPGLLLPLEQEVGRVIAARRALGHGARSLVRHAALAGSLILVVLFVVTAPFMGPITRRLFDGEPLVLLSLVLGLVAYLVQHLLRGVLAGTERFAAYGWVFALEGIARIGAVLALAVLGVDLVGAYGLILGGAPLLATVLVARRHGNLVDEGPKTGWAEMAGAVGYLVASSMLAQFLVNAGPVAVKLLASEGEEARAGAFLAGLVIARVPLFLFQAVQAPLLPGLASLASAHRSHDFVRRVRRLTATIVVVGAFVVIGAFAFGPQAVRMAFGDGFELERWSLARLAGATVLFMLAVVLAQALIALSALARVTVSWLIGCSAFVVATALGSDLMMRVETGFLLGSLATVVSMAALLGAPLKVLRPADPHLTGTAQIRVEL